MVRDPVAMLDLGIFRVGSDGRDVTAGLVKDTTGQSN
jgi:hypothetical protein